MLPTQNRLHSRTEFSDVVRRGRRASRSLLTVHLLGGPEQTPPRAGLVVSKAVGGSVVRHRVARRLRHQLAPILGDLPGGTRLVVRAGPRAAAADSAALGTELRAVVDRLLGQQR